MKKRVRDGIDGGFTFVETLAVLAVTAVLACQVSVAAMDMVQKGKVSLAKSQLENYRMALQCFYIDCGRFPSDEEGLDALWSKPDSQSEENWAGPYTDRKISADPWGNKYFYYSGDSMSLPSKVPEGIPFVLFSLGSDGKEGGTGHGKDIVSWE